MLPRDHQSMKIVVVTDAWHPQVNGVVRTLQETIDRLRMRGHHIDVISPDLFRNMACPGYPEIRLAVLPYHKTSKLLAAAQPDIVHIVTEGPLGWAARRWCKRNNTIFTSAYHTRFPEYLSIRTGINASWFWPILKRFHSHSAAVMVATPTLARELADNGIIQTALWSRGINRASFGCDFPVDPNLANKPRPIMLNVGRVAVEKNLDAFLSLKQTGTKVVVGDGPALAQLKKKYPNAIFTGQLNGVALASAYRSADIFVFPSQTDTFGLVMIEALASGLPVAAYPVPGPIDIFGADGRGVAQTLCQPAAALDIDLARAVDRAILLNPEAAIALSRQFDWDHCTKQFENALLSALSQNVTPPSPPRSAH
jgi:glycosyltransferase involved in cell wall biosynthesis